MHLLKNIFTFAAICSICAFAYATDSDENSRPVPKNAPITLKFESDARSGKLNETWDIEGKSTSAKLQADRRSSNKDKILLLENNEHGQTISLAQEVDARPWRGKIVEICGDVKANFKQVAKSGFWTRTDIPRNTLRAAATYSLPLQPTWQRACASIAVDRAAYQLRFGADSDTKGEIWFANLEVHEVSDVAKSNISDPGSRALSAIELNNLRALSKAVGYIRYFHATDALTKLDWNKFIQKAVLSVELAKSDAELANALKNLFIPYAPTTQWLTSVEIPENLLQPTDAHFKVQWVHHGLAQRDYFYHSDRVYEKLSKQLTDDVSLQGNVVQLNKIELGGQVTLWMPDLVFSTKNHETIPKVEPENGLNRVDYQLKNIVPDFSGNDRITRLGNAIQIWSALRYFYPYSDIIKIDWNKELDALLLSASSDKDEKAFTHTLMRFTSALHDGHARVTGPRELDAFHLLSK
ncbi:hypothetical protein QN372_01350 [Undibacterium sp. RTI2.1]|uniref:hypothetical protein n=1 Tax=unclassified Undibacterium TaxID=2630295 RepID=UPI002B230B4A|nr:MULTISPECIES: hypothetical protein [unclassified Undibacterium]MEB0029384.1 hypothetical protein [Undibacterium sp. RTI2.1]MEB0115997.1 hypothetical protein [Undibacterium sp. RTI2.2]